MNAGGYGARKLGGGMLLDYYGGAALGLHGYELRYDDLIDADGDFTYGGLFAGAALSGETLFIDMVLRPRIGFDLGYAAALSSGVTASDGGLSDTGSIAFDPAIGLRTYLETDFLFKDGAKQGSPGDRSAFGITPRVFCEDGFGGQEAGCGVGVGLIWESHKAADETDWRLSMDHDETSSLQRGSVELSRERQILQGAGSVSSGIRADTNGTPSLQHGYEITW